MKSKSITTITFTILSLLIVSAMVYGAAKTNKKEEWSGSYIPEQTLEGDPYGKTPVLIDVLNYPVRGDILGAEVGLSKAQSEEMVKIAHEEEDQSRELRWTKGLGAEEFNKRAYAIMRSSDEKLKQVLIPFQYVRFRDWVVEELTLNRNSMRKIRNESLLEVKPVVFYQMNFLQAQLKLSNEDTQKIRALIYQTKQKILLFREEFVGVMADQSISLERMEEIGRQIAQKISLKAQERESDILKKLPANKRKLYKSLVDAPAGK